MNDSKRLALALFGLLVAATAAGIGVNAWSGVDTRDRAAQIPTSPAEFEPAFCRGPATTACFSMPARGGADW